MVRSPFDANEYPYNSEGKYQEYVLEVCKDIDKAYSYFLTHPSSLNELKNQIELLISNMERSEKFYPKPKEKPKGKKGKKKKPKTKFEKLYEELDDADDKEKLRPLISKLNREVVRAGIFTKGSGRQKKKLMFGDKEEE